MRSFNCRPTDRLSLSDAQGDNFQCVAAAAFGLEVGTIPIVRPATAKAGLAREARVQLVRESGEAGKRQGARREIYRSNWV